MNRRLVAPVVISLAATAAIALAAAPLAAQQDLGRDGTSWSWDGPVSSGQWARIYNLSGPIRVVPSSDGSCTFAPRSARAMAVTCRPCITPSSDPAMA